jgi:hypothetical protein
MMFSLIGVSGKLRCSVVHQEARWKKVIGDESPMRRPMAMKMTIISHSKAILPTLK